MSPTPIPIFDVGGVLIEWEPRNLYRKLIPDEQEMEVFIATICPGSWNFEMDGRRSFSEGLLALISAFPEHADLIRAFDERWLETVVGPIEGTVSILAELYERGSPIYALTNFSDEKFDQLTAHFPFFGYFDGIVVSAGERLLKPDPRIYTLLCERFGLSANHCIFIDDTVANVEAARSVGMSGHHFTTPDNLRAVFRRLGLVERIEPLNSASRR